MAQPENEPITTADQLVARLSVSIPSDICDKVERAVDMREYPAWPAHVNLFSPRTLLFRVNHLLSLGGLGGDKHPEFEVKQRQSQIMAFGQRYSSIIQEARAVHNILVAEKRSYQLVNKRLMRSRSIYQPSYQYELYGINPVYGELSVQLTGFTARRSITPDVLLYVVSIGEQTTASIGHPGLDQEEQEDFQKVLRL
jgi:hypothetical protein